PYGACHCAEQESTSHEVLRIQSASFRIYVKEAVTSLVTARDRQERTQAPHLALGVLLVHPGVLYGSCCAQYTAAFFKMTRFDPCTTCVHHGMACPLIHRVLPCSPSLSRV